ncbi:MAG: hypothetical protein IKP40_06695 [Clostridia bacterium]|nr:hypothetical protein [Clostridia bacterium]
MAGQIRYAMHTGNYARGIRAAEWGIEHLRRAKEDPGKRAFPDKLISLLHLLLALLRHLDGQAEAMEADLREAVRLARAFDSDPVYTLENMVFTEHLPGSLSFFDDAGPTAVEAMRVTLDETGALVPEDFRRRLDTILNGKCC